MPVRLHANNLPHAIIAPLAVLYGPPGHNVVGEFEPDADYDPERPMQLMRVGHRYMIDEDVHPLISENDQDTDRWDGLALVTKLVQHYGKKPEHKSLVDFPEWKVLAAEVETLDDSCLLHPADEDMLTLLRTEVQQSRRLTITPYVRRLVNSQRLRSGDPAWDRLHDSITKADRIAA